MLRSASSPLLRIHPYYWVAGALVWLAFEVWRDSKKEKKPKDITLTTFHPFIPTNLFSRMLEEKGAALKIPKGSGPSQEWACLYGDKMSHSLLALCLGLGEIPRPSETEGEENNRRLFQLLFQATLAETSLQLQDRGWSFQQTAPLLDRISTVFLSTPLKKLELYPVFLEQDEDQRCESVAQQAVALLQVDPDNARHYRAAHVLARTMSLMLTSEAPRR